MIFPVKVFIYHQTQKFCCNDWYDFRPCPFVVEHFVDFCVVITEHDIVSFFQYLMTVFCLNQSVKITNSSFIDWYNVSISFGDL